MLGGAARRFLLLGSVLVVVYFATAPFFYESLIFGNAAAGLQSLAGHAGHTFVDDQGAWLLVPAFQLGLFAALWAALAGRSGWRRALLGLGALALAQALLAVPVGELAHHYGFNPHAGLIRGWALGCPGRSGLVAAAPCAAAGDSPCRGGLTLRPVSESRDRAAYSRKERGVGSGHATLVEVAAALAEELGVEPAVRGFTLDELKLRARRPALLRAVEPQAQAADAATESGASAR